MSRAFAWLLGFVLLVPACAAQAQSPSSSALMDDIGQHGAKVVVARLEAGSGDQWQDVLDKISSGEKEWLAVAASLRPGTDAGTGEDLTGALAAALLKNPVGVLSMTGPQISVDSVCDVPLIEPTDAQVARWKSQALAALASVKQPGLAAKVAACRADFQAIK